MGNYRYKLHFHLSLSGQKGREVSLRLSPLDLIMNQIRRKCTATDRQPSARYLSRSPSGRVVISDLRGTDGKDELDGAADSGVLMISDCLFMSDTFHLQCFLSS